MKISHLTPGEELLMNVLWRLDSAYMREIIEQYPDDYPYPSCLILGMSIEDKYLHVVIGNHESDLFLITAYFPSFDKWESDFKTRKENA